MRDKSLLYKHNTKARMWTGIVEQITAGHPASRRLNVARAERSRLECSETEAIVLLGLVCSSNSKERITIHQ